MEKGVSVKELQGKFHKEYGASVGGVGMAMQDLPRIPTGVFPLDLAIGGGLPACRCTIIYGPESSNKTNLLLVAIARHQKHHPDRTCSVVDFEGLDPVWAAKLGVDMEKLGWFRPQYAEQAVDIVENLLYAEDCGIVGVDSLAMMGTQNELESSAEKAIVGGASSPIGKMCRKTARALMAAEIEGRTDVALIYINQTRFKIGVMFGDPETMPGGNAPRFQVAMWIRVYGKNKLDPKVHKVMPVLKETTFVLKKWKVPIISPTGKFDMAMLPHKELQPGEVDDWNTISAYLKHYGQIQKADKKGWQILGEHYPTLEAFRSRLNQEQAFGDEVREALLKRVAQDGLMAAIEEEE